MQCRNIHRTRSSANCACGGWRSGHHGSAAAAALASSISAANVAGRSGFDGVRLISSSAAVPVSQAKARLASHVTCAHGGRGSDGDDDGNYYEVLGVPTDASEEDIKGAFRRKAKELHPDINKEGDADSAFMVAKRAYETLSDAARRREYDRLVGVRRMNFFRDVQEDGDFARSSPFRWSSVGQSDDDDQTWQRSTARPGPEYPKPFSDEDDEEEDEEEGAARPAPGQRDAGEGSEHDAMDHEEFLRRLSRVMGRPFGSGSLKEYQAGRIDPWGTGSSDAWHKQVEKQMRGAPGSWDSDDGAGEGGRWDPLRRRGGDEPPGWRPPGRGPEWQHPRRMWDEEDQRGGGGGGRGGDDGSRRPFKI